jgi:hypothetical protein
VNPNLNPSKRADVVGSIDPDAYAAGTYTTGWIDMSKFFSVLAVVMAGTLGASATLDAKIQQAQDSGGTGAKDISGLAITQLTQAGADSNKQALINVMQSDLDRANNFALRPPLDDHRDGGVRRRRRRARPGSSLRRRRSER